ncbi:MAG: YifB family Mg chelatase-like AAA ATPase [Myxococcales bacterium]
MLVNVPAPVIRGRVLGLGASHASVLVGLDAYSVRIEVASTRGPAFFQMVGLAEAAVRESRVRVTSALARLGVLLDEFAITVNLAPADLRKSGAALDLAISLAILAALDRVENERLETLLLLGELSLDGRLQSIRGVLPLLLGAKREGFVRAIVPFGNRAEAGLVEGIDTFAAADLQSVIEHLHQKHSLVRAPKAAFEPRSPHPELNLATVRGQNTARRALEIAAAGRHNLLFVGPPGGGKTLLARTLPSILPPLEFEEALELTAIHSVAGLIDTETGICVTRPFRAPHHSVSEAGLIGGGDIPRPGEVSLAHHGVLFLDELAEFRRAALEALRQPLEDGAVQIARARAKATFPALPLVVAAVNPCACGYYGHPVRACRCTELQRRRYLGRLSGPLLDRIDLHCPVPPVDVGSLSTAAPGESSEQVRVRVVAAHQCQRERYERGLVRAATNSGLTLPEAERVAALNQDSQQLIEHATVRLGLSARAYLRILRVARTIADLDRAPTVGSTQIAEAIQARLLDRDAGM